MRFSTCAVAVVALSPVVFANHKPAPPIPTQTLPLKTHVYADASCSQSRANLYYLPDGFCIGPLYHPASSIRVSNAVPSYCNLTAYSDGRCRGSEVSVRTASSSSGMQSLLGRKQKVLNGPTVLGSCFGVGEDPVNTGDDLSEVLGANSFFLRCS